MGRCLSDSGVACREAGPRTMHTARSGRPDPRKGHGEGDHGEPANFGVKRRETVRTRFPCGLQRIHPIGEQYAHGQPQPCANPRFGLGYFPSGPCRWRQFSHLAHLPVPEYYCVIDEGHNITGNTEADRPALGRPGFAGWQSNAGYDVALAPRGFQSGGTSGRASWSCPARAEGEKRLRSAIRKPYAAMQSVA
jgi:hypothetical protein